MTAAGKRARKAESRLGFCARVRLGRRWRLALTTTAYTRLSSAAKAHDTFFTDVPRKIVRVRITEIITQPPAARRARRTRK